MPGWAAKSAARPGLAAELGCREEVAPRATQTDRLDLAVQERKRAAKIGGLKEAVLRMDQPIVRNSVERHVFVKKDDAEGGDHYYLGQALSQDPVETTMPGTRGEPLPVVTMLLRIETDVSLTV